MFYNFKQYRVWDRNGTEMDLGKEQRNSKHVLSHMALPLYLYWPGTLLFILGPAFCSEYESCGTLPDYMEDLWSAQMGTKKRAINSFSLLTCLNLDL